MKSRLNLLVALILIGVLLVACSSPIKDYRKEIVDREIVAKIEAIQSQVNVIIGLAESIEPLESTDTDMFIESYDQMISESNILSLLVEDSYDAIRDIDLSASDVSEINEQLKVTLDTYDDMASTLMTSAAVLKDITILTENVMNTYDDFMVLLFRNETPSDEFIQAFSFLITEYQEELLFATEGMAPMIASGSLDLLKINDVKASILEARTTIESASPNNDIDLLYKDTILVFINGIIELMTVTLDHEQIILDTASHDSILDYIDNINREAESKIKNWEKEIEE